MDWTIEKSRLDFQEGKHFSVPDSTHASSRTTQLHKQWVPEDLSRG
jgi:hypothetical protein